MAGLLNGHVAAICHIQSFLGIYFELSMLNHIFNMASGLSTGGKWRVIPGTIGHLGEV